MPAEYSQLYREALDLLIDAGNADNPDNRNTLLQLYAEALQRIRISVDVPPSQLLCIEADIAEAQGVPVALWLRGFRVHLAYTQRLVYQALARV